VLLLIYRVKGGFDHGRGKVVFCREMRDGRVDAFRPNGAPGWYLKADHHWTFQEIVRGLINPTRFNEEARKLIDTTSLILQGCLPTDAERVSDFSEAQWYRPQHRRGSQPVLKAVDQRQ
jgi:hypothetical protein